MAFEMRNGMIRSPQAWAQQDAEHERLRSAVVEASKRLYYTDGSDDSHDGSYMRSLYAKHKAAVDVLVKFEKASHSIGQKDGEQV